MGKHAVQRATQYRDCETLAPEVRDHLGGSALGQQHSHGGSLSEPAHLMSDVSHTPALRPSAGPARRRSRSRSAGEVAWPLPGDVTPVADAAAGQISDYAERDRSSGSTGPGSPIWAKWAHGEVPVPVRTASGVAPRGGRGSGPAWCRCRALSFADGDSTALGDRRLARPCEARRKRRLRHGQPRQAVAPGPDVARGRRPHLLADDHLPPR